MTSLPAMTVFLLFAAALCAAACAGEGGMPGLPGAAASDTMRWAAATFGSAREDKPGPRPMGPTLTLRRQDYGQLGRNQSCIGTPLKIGTQGFKRGLGSHANSEIAVSFAPGSAKAFRTSVGVDNNHDTQGKFGTVEFIVEIAGKEVLHTRVLRSSDEAVPVAIDIPAAASELVLRTDATPDGPSHDHADWADAQLVMQDGATVWLDELVPAPKAGELWPMDKPPFLFSYDGKLSSGFLASWQHKTQSKDEAGRVVHTAAWTDPQTGLDVAATATAFKDFPAVDWVLRFTNTGAQDTPILSQVAALDLLLGTAKEQSLVLDQINGDDCSERSFVPIERELKAGQSVALAPVGGRPSNGTFPFFNLQCGAGGFFVAIGWTGQWSASLRRDAAGPTGLQAGMELTHLLLHPGKTIRTPRILL
ncbi:MAG: NPCBM/NEW2 domain-containing protein, partial [Planctomycetota bacterium]